MGFGADMALERALMEEDEALSLGNTLSLGEKYERGYVDESGIEDPNYTELMRSQPIQTREYLDSELNRLSDMLDLF